MIGWTWGWRSLELDETTALMMRVKPETADGFWRTFDVQKTAPLLSPSGGRQYVCGESVDGTSIEDGTDTSKDLVNLSNDSMSTRGKALTDRAKSLDIQLYM